MQLSTMSSRLFTTAAMVAAVACNTTNEGSASVKGTVNGKSLQAQSALFVSTAVQAAANGNTTVGDANATTGGAVGNSNSMGDMNAKLPLHAGAAGQSLIVTVSSQTDVCSQAGDGKQPANTDYLVLSLAGTKAIVAGTYNIAGGDAAVDANNLLPGNLTPGATSTGTTTKAFKRALRAEPVGDANTASPAGDANAALPTADANTTSPTGDANSIAPDASVVATADYVSVDAKCGGVPVAAKSGTVTLTQVDATGTVEGTFNVTLSTGDVLTGSFKAQSCAPLMSSNASPYRCN